MSSRKKDPAAIRAAALLNAELLRRVRATGEHRLACWKIDIDRRYTVPDDGDGRSLHWCSDVAAERFPLLTDPAPGVSFDGVGRAFEVRFPDLPGVKLTVAVKPTARQEIAAEADAVTVVDEIAAALAAAQSRAVALAASLAAPAARTVAMVAVSPRPPAALVPQMYGEAVARWGPVVITATMDEWDNRTTHENALWLLSRFAELLGRPGGMTP